MKLLCYYKHSNKTISYIFIYSSYILVITLCTSQSGDIGSKCCYYLSTVLDTEHVFTLLYEQFIGSPHKMTKVTFLSSHVGSDKLRKVCIHIKAFKLHTASLYVCTYVCILYNASFFDHSLIIL